MIQNREEVTQTDPLSTALTGKGAAPSGDGRTAAVIPPLADPTFDKGGIIGREDTGAMGEEGAVRVPFITTEAKVVFEEGVECTMFVVGPVSVYPSSF